MVTHQVIFNMAFEDETRQDEQDKRNGPTKHKTKQDETRQHKRRPSAKQLRKGAECDLHVRKNKTWLSTRRHKKRQDKAQNNSGKRQNVVLITRKDMAGKGKTRQHNTT